MLKNIQCLRFFAAFLVMLHHFPITPFIHHEVTGKDFFSIIIQMGFSGVDIFFVISGFIMAETTRNIPPGCRNSLHFLVKRFGRIYIGWWPLFFFYLLLKKPPYTSITGSFFLLPQDTSRYMLPVIWTLSFELYFYCMTALLIFWKRRQGAKLFLMLGFLLVFANIFLINDGFYHPMHEAQAKKTLLIPFYLSPLILEFIMGFLLSEWFSRKPVQHLSIWLPAAAVSGFTACYFQIYGNLNPSGMAGFYHVPERAILLGVFSMCLVACAVILERKNICCIKIFESMGNASYSIYLLHIAGLIIMGSLYGKITHFMRLPNSFWVLATVFLILFMSWIFHLRLERPLHDGFKNFLSRHFFLRKQAPISTKK